MEEEEEGFNEETVGNVNLLVEFDVVDVVDVVVELEAILIKKKEKVFFFLSSVFPKRSFLVFLFMLFSTKNEYGM